MNKKKQRCLYKSANDKRQQSKSLNWAKLLQLIIIKMCSNGTKTVYNVTRSKSETSFVHRQMKSLNTSLR